MGLRDEIMLRKLGQNQTTEVGFSKSNGALDLIDDNGGNIQKEFVNKRKGLYEEAANMIREEKKNRLHLVLIFDESGSMWGQEDDMEKGSEALFESLRDRNILVTAYAFSDEYRILCDDEPISKVRKLNIMPNGSTRMYDTVETAINSFNEGHSVNDKAVYIITSDGRDNLSKLPWMNKKTMTVRDAIKSEEDLGRPVFYFGEDKNAIQIARGMGISEERAIRYFKEERGLISNFKSIAIIIEEMLSKGKVETEDWKEPVKQHVLALEYHGLKKR